MTSKTMFHTSIGRTRPWLAALAGLSTLAAVGCGEGLTGNDDVQQVAGDVRALGQQPDAASTIAFEKLSDDVGARAATKTRTLIRTASGYRSFFGHAPPAAVDFSREWVMFYAAGTEPSGGYEASFTAVLRAGGSLIAITQLVSPGALCAEPAIVTTPYALIKFPAQPGTSAQFYKSDSILDCAAGMCAATQCPKGMDCDPATGKCICGPVCAIYCEYGNVLDANGCATCTCNPPPSDPCATVKCAAGTHCDAGKCTADVSCGGLAGKPCPGMGKCVDDPSDSCDPKTGGADCGGICSCVQNVLCTTDSHFDSSPSVCACVPLK
ncbi:MAG TPA: hypothetical protein VHM31_00460 [Polyangia bacterium]|nr:hypothetical protein [Polyangia bacterium]